MFTVSDCKRAARHAQQSEFGPRRGNIIFVVLVLRGLLCVFLYYKLLCATTIFSFKKRSAESRGSKPRAASAYNVMRKQVKIA